MLFYVQDEQYVMMPRMALNDDVQDEQYVMMPLNDDIQDEYMQLIAKHNEMLLERKLEI